MLTRPLALRDSKDCQLEINKLIYTQYPPAFANNIIQTNNVMVRHNQADKAMQIIMQIACHIDTRPNPHNLRLRSRPATRNKKN